MRKLFQFFFLLFILSSTLQAQDYLAFEEPIISTMIGNRVFTNEKGEECTLASKSEVKILGRGYNKKKGKYYFKNEKCSGFISFAWFAPGKGFKEQDKKVNARRYEMRNAQILKEIEEEKEVELKAKKEELYILKNECSYTRNEVEIFDKVKVIRTSAKRIADGLHVILYAKGNIKKVVFSTINLGCTSPYKNNRSWVKVMLENNDVLTFYHSGQLDCSGFELWGNVSNSEILRLKKSQIKAIKMEGTEYNHTITDFDWPTFFIDQLKCFEPS